MKRYNPKLSMFLSYILRHHPEDLGLYMESNGWVNVDELIEKLNTKPYYDIDFEDIKLAVDNNDKKRFSLEEREDGWYIRARQGHSIKSLDMEYEAVKPPKVLYHGTADRFLKSIMNKGLLAKTRQYVHLSEDINTAEKVGERHGNVVVLWVDAEKMYNDGIEFYLSENGVWLTSYVDSKYLKLL